MIPAGDIITSSSSSVENPPPKLVACPDCDLLSLIPEVPAGRRFCCSRCGATIARASCKSLDRILALSATGLLLYLPAILLPLLTLSSIGFKESANVLDSCLHFLRNGYVFVAFAVFCSAVVFPLLKLFIPFYASLGILTNRQVPGLIKGLRLLKQLDEWGMVEVYLLGIIITLIKAGDMASISYNPGFFCFIGLVLISMATTACFDYRVFWNQVPTQDNPIRKTKISSLQATLDKTPSLMITAAESGLSRCLSCGLLVCSQTDIDETIICNRCGAVVRTRKKNSLAKTWALILTSLLLFIPANTLPIMRVDFLGIPDHSTILDGILYFFNEGSYGVGLIILSASVLVPLFKIIGMLIILLTIRFCKNIHLKQKARMFRFIEFIGRWSMLDIFVIALLTVLVDFGFLTSVHTAPAATYFCIVVIATMLAAIVFDPRIMWDECARASRQTPLTEIIRRP